MSTEHPELTRALANGDAREIIRIGLGARLAAEDGRYCECSDPRLIGYDLMCGACLLNNRDQERRAVIRIVRAHPFELDTKREASALVGWCWCTHRADHPRHNGIDGTGRTSWGEEVAPPYAAHLLAPATPTTEGRNA